MKIFVVAIRLNGRGRWFPHSAGWWHTAKEARKHFHDHIADELLGVEFRVQEYKATL